MKWFSSDWHLGHKRVIEFSKRPFFSFKEMDDKIIDNMISPLKRGDCFYFLGDLYWDKNSLQKLFDRWPNYVKFFMILGNHDNKNYKYIYDNYRSKFNSFDLIKEVKFQNYHIVLCHYPMRSWNRSHYNSWQLFGHHHKGGLFSPYENNDLGKQLNVNCEYHDFRPWNEEEIIEYMKTRPNNFDLIKKENNNE